MIKSNKTIFLHHSTGSNVWKGDRSRLLYKFGKVLSKITGEENKYNELKILFRKYNKKNNTHYVIEERNFPTNDSYGWRNYPFDYYNIWVKHAGNETYLKQPTLEILTKEYQTIILKHCFPVCNIKIDKDSADVNSDYKSLSNYKLQYLALRDKFHQFPHIKFIVWTGAALVKSQTDEDEAKRAQEFFKWVLNEWDLANDNIFVWDFYSLQTEGNLYFQDTYAVSDFDSHPNNDFSEYVSRLLFNRIIDVIENNGNNTKIDGNWK